MNNLLEELEKSGLAGHEKFAELIKLYPQDFYNRANVEGHITSSAFVVNPARDKILLVFHKKLQEWLQPGGHVDTAITPYENALKELSEEAYGSRPVHFRALNDAQIFHLDIHGIGSHYHYDISYLFEVSDAMELSVSHESEDVRWHKISDVLECPTSNTTIVYICRKILEGV